MRAVMDMALPARIYAEQVKLLYRNLPLGLLATQANAFILLAIQWSVIDHGVLLAWFAAITLTAVSRVGLFAAYRRAHLTQDTAHRWVAWFTIGTVLSGIIWGSAGILLFPSEMSHQVFIIFVLAGMTAGAVVSFSALWKIGLIFILFTLTPLSVRLFAEGRDMHLAMGVMSLLFMLLMVIISRRMYQTTLTSLQLRFENSDLVAVLATEKEATEDLNRELRREISERVRIEAGLRESEAHVRAVIDNVPDGIITLNEQGRLESVNPAALRIFGYSRDEMTGSHLKTLMPESVRHEYDDYIKQQIGASTGKMVGFGLEITGQRKDGSRFPMELGIGNMWLDSRHLFIGIVRDISERREVGRMKNQFMSSVSHELRTPLTSVLGSLGLLAEGVGGDLSESGKALLNISRNNVARLARLIRYIIDIDEINSVRLKFDFRATDLATLVVRAVDGNHTQASAAGVNLVLRSDVTQASVYGDAERLVQSLGHLLSNALKFSPRGSTVEVSVARHETGIRVAVMDQGPGIPDAFRDRLFQPFSQAESTDSDFRGGAGLGLSIAKAIIQQHAGTIGYESMPGRGACFYFDLPELHTPPA
jgi:PAS domain S-box-containing protein